MRTVTANCLTEPSAAVARTFSFLPTDTPPLMPSIEYVSSPVKPSVCADSPRSNCSGSTPMPMRLLRWMRSKLCAMAARTPSKRGPFAAQSRDDPEPYSAPAITMSGVPSS